MQVAALAGGVGAAKFLRGLVRVMDPQDLTIIGNTGDDAIFHGLHVSPDIDTVIYTLAELVDSETGWGVSGDTNKALDRMKELGVDAWFKLGDSDIGLHMARTTWLRDGATLAEVTDRIRIKLGLKAKVLPVTNDAVRTQVVTVGGIRRDFQDYFVRQGHSEEVTRVDFKGSEDAEVAPGVIEALLGAEKIIICPSNPVVSMGPILSIAGVFEALSARSEDVVAISPLVGGKALRGPADRLMAVAGPEASAFGVAKLYSNLCGSFVVDEIDAAEVPRIESLGMVAIAVNTVMETPEVAEQLAKEVLAL